MAGERILRGYKKLELMRHLATGEHSQAYLAELYDLTESGVSAFKRRNAQEIQEIVDNIDDRFAGMWIAKKEKRIAEYLSQVELVQDSTDADAPMLRVAQAALRAVADELGDIPNKSTVEVKAETVTYTVEGVDLETLV